MQEFVSSLFFSSQAADVVFAIVPFGTKLPQVLDLNVGNVDPHEE